MCNTLRFGSVARAVGHLLVLAVITCPVRWISSRYVLPMKAEVNPPGDGP
jgi:hypothetical protein